MLTSVNNRLHVISILFLQCFAYWVAPGLQRRQTSLSWALLFIFTFYDFAFHPIQHRHTLSSTPSFPLPSAFQNYTIRLHWPVVNINVSRIKSVARTWGGSISVIVTWSGWWASCACCACGTIPTPRTYTYQQQLTFLPSFEYHLHFSSHVIRHK